MSEEKNPLKKIATWSCCNNCDQFKNKKCCGGDIYYPTECPEHSVNEEKTSGIMDQYEIDAEEEFERDMDEYNKECLEANNPY